MVRQAHSYLVGAMSGATLIAMAIAAFVLLASAQVFRDWPLPGLVGGEESSSLSERPPAGGSEAPTLASAAAGRAVASSTNPVAPGGSVGSGQGGNAGSGRPESVLAPKSV